MTPDRLVVSLVVAATALIVVGCDTRNEQTSAAGMTDCRVSPSPAVSIGGLEPPAHTFGNVSDVGRLPNGNIAVADRIARTVTIFDTAGEPVRALGREGEGPGEFLDPIAVAATDSALLVWDWDQLRVTRFDLATDEVGAYRVEGLTNLSHHFGDLPGGFVVGSVGFPDRPRDARSWTSEMAVVRWDSGRGSLDTVVAFKHETSQWVDESIRLAGSPTFSPEGTFAAGGGSVYWTEGDSAVVHYWDDGTIGRIEWDWPTRTVSPGDVEAHLQRWLARVSEQVHEAIREQVATLPVAEVFPTASDLVHDVDGGVWVGIYATPSDTTQTWLRFEDDEIDCRLEMPRSFEPTEGARTWLVGVRTDELDIERVELWAIEY